jgi:hypothetical protein
MNKARQRFLAVIVQTQFALAARSTSPIAAARQWQEGVYSVEKLEILRPPFFSRKSLVPKMALTYLV